MSAAFPQCDTLRVIGCGVELRCASKRQQETSTPARLVELTPWDHLHGQYVRPSAMAREL